MNRAPSWDVVRSRGRGCGRSVRCAWRAPCSGGWNQPYLHARARRGQSVPFESSCVKLASFTHPLSDRPAALVVALLDFPLTPEPERLRVVLDTSATKQRGVRIKKKHLAEEWIDFPWHENRRAREERRSAAGPSC